MTHTPGPWTSHGAGGEIHGDSRVVATMTWCSGMDAEDEANACLVEAAPDMLEALQDLMEADAEELLDGASDVWGRVAAAIAKATRAPSEGATKP